MPEFVAFSIVIILLLAGYWSLVIFPKQRTFKKHNQYVRTLAVGDEVISYGGIIGQVISIDADSGVGEVKIAEGVIVRMLTASLSRPYLPEEVSINARIGVEPGIEAQAERHG